MMKKMLLGAAVLLALVSCGSKNNPEKGGESGGSDTKVNVAGTWELSGVATKVAVGDVNVSVYLSFEGSSFTLYQKIGEGRYTRFTGSYNVSSDNKLSGSYDGGSSWGPYDAALSSGNLVLTSPGGKEVDTYKKISSIPASVLSNLY